MFCSFSWLGMNINDEADKIPGVLLRTPWGTQHEGLAAEAARQDLIMLSTIYTPLPNDSANENLVDEQPSFVSCWERDFCCEDVDRSMKPLSFDIAGIRITRTLVKLSAASFAISALGLLPRLSGSSL